MIELTVVVNVICYHVSVFVVSVKCKIFEKV